MSQRESIGKWLSATYRHIQMNIKKEFEHYQIGSGQYQILVVLHKNDGINQETISKILNLDKATVGRAVGKLERKGYVKREKDPMDHRAYILHLTKKGKKLAPVIKKYLTKLSTILLSEFTPDEKEIALKLLKRMYQNITSEEIPQKKDK